MIGMIVTEKTGLAANYAQNTPRTVDDFSLHQQPLARFRLAV